MLRTAMQWGRIAVMAFVLATAVSAGRAVAVSPPGSPPDLRTPGNTFTSSSHYVSTIVFPWFTSTGGATAGVWQPLEGRASWTGEPNFWEGQIKQMMAANIDVMHVWTFPVWAGYDKQRTNLFQALGQLRAQGYNVPKVAPMLDTTAAAGTGWFPNTPHAHTTLDLSTVAGKDAFVNQYSYFYTQYYSVNTDDQADSYVAKIDGRVILNSHFFGQNELGFVNAVNLNSISRTDVQSRLTAALGSEQALFRDLATVPGNGIWVMNTRDSALGIADDKVIQFADTNPYRTNGGALGRWQTLIMPGFWSALHPEWPMVPRNGGATYRNGWNSTMALRNSGIDVKQVTLESWNEFGEGSGIYAANPVPQPPPGDTHTDTWSSTSDPYEYIKTTADFARVFNDTVDRDARILWNNLPATMQPGQTSTYQVIVRNDGDLSWTGAAEFKFGEKEWLDPILFGALNGRTLIDDVGNEIPTYGGIFRGRPLTFDVQLTAPTTPGVYSTHWGMVQEGVAWFGDELVVPITVAVPEPSPLALLAMGMLSLLVGVATRRKGRCIAIRPTTFLTSVVFGCSVFSVAGAQAGLFGPEITGVTATVNRGIDDLNAPVANLVNNSGMSGDYQDPTISNAYWRQYAPYGFNAKVTFDLGYLPPPYHYNVNAIKIWNYLEPTHMDMGVKNITLWSSANGTSYTQIGSTYTLTENSTYGWDPSGIRDLIPLGGVNARYIRLDVLSNYGDPYWYGLGEVRFFGVDPIPEPGTLTLLTCGLAGLLAYAWRKRKASMIYDLTHKRLFVFPFFLFTLR